MINRIKALFDGLTDKTDSVASLFKDRHVATAALLVEAASMDGDFGEAEAATIRDILSRHFDFSEDEIESLIEEGREMATDASQIIGFTRALKDACDEDERIAMMEMLWEVAYADGELHDYEANLMRRVAGLLYVGDRESGAARKRALDRLGLDG